MRVSLTWVILGVVIALVLVLVVGVAVLQPGGRLIPEAGFSLTVISPNADGLDDVTTFKYTLKRAARVSLVLESDDAVYQFRTEELRAPGEYYVDFSGVVDGFVLPGEEFIGQVVRRLIPDGEYTWHFSAVEENGESTDTHTGTLTVQDGQAELPIITVFTITPDEFTPNQDSISDWTEMNVVLSTDASLQVYLEGENDSKIFVAPRDDCRKDGEAGRHCFFYEGGIDLGADPPADGTYRVVARAQDAEGQVFEAYSELTIRNGGKPLAEILPQSIGVDVVFAVQPYEDRYFTNAMQVGDLVDPPGNPQDLSQMALRLPLGDMLVFKLSVENYSDVPVRTTGPQPGTVYDQRQRAASLNAFDESGAWRVGIDCTTAETDYPWRWGLGTAETEGFYEEVDPNSGKTFLYMEPGAQAVVWGAIRMTEIEARNPQNCWAGLIHEDVEVSLRNQNVGAREVEIVDFEQVVIPALGE